MKSLKTTQRHVLPVLIVTVIISLIAVPALAADPLVSWREGTNKRLIIEFVEKVTTPGRPDFVAPEDRVATFDMDGTVLLEKPAYALFAFAIPLIKAAAAAQPELLKRPHVKAIVDGDMKYFAKAGKFGPEGLYATLLETHTGKTEARYLADASAFLFGQKHPRFQVPYAETVYLPMLEMIRYLEENGFRVYICSGSDIAFIRAMIEKSIGLPLENAIGTQVATTWVENDKGSEFRREHVFVEPVNDEKGKPVNILRMVGKRPIIAVGNSEGDRDMLEYSDDKNPATPDLQMIVNHDDPEREYEYAVEKVNNLAAENNWHVISMKKDWERVFDFLKK
ncbi:MAG: HAD family hydrolase [Desulfobacterales bacterium]